MALPTTPSPLPAFVNHVSWAHRHTHCVLTDCFPSIRANLDSCDGEGVACKDESVCCRVLYRKQFSSSWEEVGYMVILVIGPFREAQRKEGCLEQRQSGAIGPSPAYDLVLCSRVSITGEGLLGVSRDKRHRR